MFSIVQVFSLMLACVLPCERSSAQPMWDSQKKLNKQASYSRRQTDPTVITFEYPVEYNLAVQKWIQFFQGNGRRVFSSWLSRSNKYLPAIQKVLVSEGLPADLAYMVMIESGFMPHATSSAKAVGPWQFINETGERYGLTTNWWLDERRDFDKSSRAAAKYLKYLHSLFNCWNLAAAGYNAGENKIIRLMDKHQTRSFWQLAKISSLATETKDYVPKLIATMLIAKAPGIYGFRNVKSQQPVRFEHFHVPGGTRLDHLAQSIGFPPDTMRELNPELIRGYIPFQVTGRNIRIPHGSSASVSAFVRKQVSTTASM
ncbi:MAG: lytic transglycosylase domain-containing protein [Bdellovibrionales bacterium]